MYNHTPSNYVCPICLAVKGVENDATMIKQADIFFRDEKVMALINSKFVGKNEGHVIVVPIEHYEHIYDLPDEIASHILVIAKRIAVAMKKTRNCEGIMMLQNNEPASGQHAFHYHLHLFPRFTNDQIYGEMEKARVSKPEERIVFSNELKKTLQL
jgi:histidine triad (HIT) family protein